MEEGQLINNEHKYRVHLYIINILLVISIAVCSYRIGYHFGTKNVNSIVETLPETEVTETTMEETTAPVETSVPVTEETIPTTEETTEKKPTVVPTEPPSEPPSAPVRPESWPGTPVTDLDMLACVIFQEAGGNGCCDDCRRRVADVVLNRVESDLYPDTIHDVLTQHNQYGRMHWTGVVWTPQATDPKNRHAVERAYRIAEEVLNGQHSELYGKGYIWQAEFPQGREQIKCCGIYFGRN